MTQDRTDTGRRAFLASVAAAGVGLAGCSGFSSDFPGDDSGSPTGTPGSGNESSQGNGGTQGDVQSSDPGTYEPMAPKAASFEDLSYWTAHAGVTLEADGENAYQGSQSARIEGRSGSIQREFPVPKNLENLDISLAMKVGAPASTNLRIFLFDTGGNQTQLMQGYHGKHPDGWVRVNPSIDEANADMTSINRLLITLDGGGENKKYWVDDIRFHEKTADTGQVMFTFDYVTRSIYEVAFPMMKQRDIQGVVAVAGDRVGNADRLTVEELREMKDAGWEIASMTNDFGVLYGQSEEVQRQRIQRGKELIQGWDLGEPAALMYPKGFCDDTTVSLAAEHHDLGFLTFGSSERGLSQSAIMGPQFVNRSRPSTADAVKNQVRPAVAYNGLYTIHQNRIGPNADNNREVFRAILDHVQQQRDQGNVKIVQPSDLVLE